MSRLTVICVGKLKESFYLDASREYCKRLSAYGEAQLIELPEQQLPENPARAQIDAALRKEAEAIRAKLPKGAYLVVCTPEGKQMSSEALSELLQRLKTEGRSAFCFVIGSSFGLDEGLKVQADLRLSFSPMTFPHHLFRVMLLEQLYRAEAIAAGSKYHK